MVEDLETSPLDGKCPSQDDYVYNRPVCFQVLSASLYGLSGGGVLVANQDRTTTSSRQDSNSIRKGRKCKRQASSQDSFQVGGATVWIQSRGGSVKY